MLTQPALRKQHHPAYGNHDTSNDAFLHLTYSTMFYLLYSFFSTICTCTLQLESTHTFALQEDGSTSALTPRSLQLGPVPGVLAKIQSR